MGRLEQFFLLLHFHVLLPFLGIVRWANHQNIVHKGIIIEVGSRRLLAEKHPFVNLV